ncbi:MAG: hypothetical protein ACJ75J_18500, partial [Cytophagaceae bacterium]
MVKPSNIQSTHLISLQAVVCLLFIHFYSFAQNDQQARAMLDKGIAEYNSGQYNSALTDFSIAIDIQPGYE